MFYFVLQLWDTAITHRIHIFELFVIYCWVIYLVRWYFAHKFFNKIKQIHYPQNKSIVTCIIPILNEKPENLEACLLSLYSQKHKQDIIIVVRDKKDNGCCNSVIDRYADYNLLCQKRGKREAIAMALKYAIGDIAIISDSDTILEKGAYDELLRPFTDEKVGGATTNQRIFNPYGNVWRIICQWMEVVRFNVGAVPSQAYFNTVGCLPGRCVAFRISAITPHIEEYLNEKFLGRDAETSDDRYMTSLILQDGV